MIMSLKQKKIKFKPRTKLNHNKYINNISFCTCTTEWRSKGGGVRDGAVVRALTSHQCGPGSNPRINAICGLSLLLVLSLAPRDFSPGTPVFPPPKTNISKFQFDQESGIRRTTLWMCYLQNIIYLFFFYVKI